MHLVIKTGYSSLYKLTFAHTSSLAFFRELSVRPVDICDETKQPFTGEYIFPDDQIGNPGLIFQGHKNNAGGR